MKVLDLIEYKNLDILCLVETKIIDSPACLANCTPPGYQSFQVQRRGATKSGAGGVAVIIKKCFFAFKRIFQKKVTKYFEFLALEIKSKKNSRPLVLVTIYRPPGTIYISQFITEFLSSVKSFLNRLMIT